MRVPTDRSRRAPPDRRRPLLFEIRTGLGRLGRAPRHACRTRRGTRQCPTSQSHAASWSVAACTSAITAAGKLGLPSQPTSVRTDTRAPDRITEIRNVACLGPVSDCPYVLRTDNSMPWAVLLVMLYLHIECSSVRSGQSRIAARSDDRYDDAASSSR